MGSGGNMNFPHTLPHAFTYIHDTLLPNEPAAFQRGRRSTGEEEAVEVEWRERRLRSKEMQTVVRWRDVHVDIFFP